MGKHLKAFISKAELETGHKVKVLCSYRGGEYTAQHIQQFLEECRISHEMTTANTPQHNGIAECLNCTLLDCTQAMLSDVKLPDSYWLEVLNYAVLLHNVSPTQPLPTTPTEAYSGIKLNISQLHIFGCVAHIHVPEQSCNKLSAHSLPCTFLGFAAHHSTFCLVHHPTHKFLESRDVIFNEGGPTPCHKHIILKPNNTPPTDNTPPSTSIPEASPAKACPVIPPPPRTPSAPLTLLFQMMTHNTRSHLMATMPMSHTPTH